MDEYAEELQKFASALSDLERLKIIGQLAKGQGRVSELALQTGIDPDSLAHHLQKLIQSGVVSSLKNASGEEEFHLDAKALEQMAKRQFMHAKKLQHQEPDKRQIGAEFSPEEAKIIRNYTYRSGKIKQMPTTRKKSLILMRYVLQALAKGTIYTEKQINALFGEYWNDPTSIRRDLVDLGILARHADGSAYWLAEVQYD